MPRAATYQALISFVIAAFALYRMQRISPSTNSRLQWVPLGRKWIPLGFLSLYLVAIRIPLIPFSKLTFEKIIDVAIFIGGVALVEEALFRGWLFARLEKLNIWVAIFGSSVIFGFIHLINLNSGLHARYVIIQVFVAMTLGYIFSALMLYTGTIWVPIAFHFLMDFPIFLVAQFDQLDELLPADNGVVTASVVAVSGINIIIGSLFLKTTFAAVRREIQESALHS
jgi:membrane protease YdiL (CAAX protease family)